MLTGRGYRRPVLLSGLPSWPSAARRERGVRTALAEADVVPVRVVDTDLSRDAGHRAVMELPGPVLRRCDVVICASDPLAFGASTALRLRGVRVGAEVGVCGFGDVPGASDVRPGLTTVHLPLIEAGARAFRPAFEKVSDQHVVLRTRVVVRDSTPPRTPTAVRTRRSPPSSGARRERGTGEDTT
ncbi:substrate-binding domain-containing protein [Streptomyces sp. NPDC059894]|uniref:substrate-binding domain-containing protein n=1 Tax=unclassified Streptomyces TaxID=2593676 RepID=UPI0036590F98